MLEKLPAALGEALQKKRAGIEHTVIHRVTNAAALARLEVRSSAFDADKPIDAKYTADGRGISPPLEWQGVPEQASRVLVIVEDADSPTPQPLVHAIIVSNDPRESSFIEGALDSPDHTGVGLQTGLNSYLSKAWLPPDPPPAHGAHRYVFQVFALREAVMTQSPGRHEMIRAIEDHGLAAGYVIGIYERAIRATVNDGEAATTEAALISLPA